MNKAEEDLEVILDLLAEWRWNNGLELVSAWIDKRGYGVAYSLNGDQISNRVRKDYEPAGRRRTGSGK